MIERRLVDFPEYVFHIVCRASHAYGDTEYHVHADGPHLHYEHLGHAALALTQEGEHWTNSAPGHEWSATLQEAIADLWRRAIVRLGDEAERAFSDPEETVYWEPRHFDEVLAELAHWRALAAPHNLTQAV